MNDYEVMNKWFPDHLASERSRRLHKERGRFIYCKHYRATKEFKFICTKYMKERSDCYGCRTCSNCDGSLAFYQSQASIKPDGIYHREAFICVHCGAYVEYERIQAREGKQKDTRRAGKCEVAGCRHTAYEGYEYHDAQLKWIICYPHFRRVKTWRYHKDKGEESKPILVIMGKLEDNPDYKKKTAG